MIDIESSFKKQYEEAQEIINLRKSYEELLLAGISGAQNVYQASAQQAEQQASYDISGAYANYLKQQRNIAAQGHLESGYKEEVGDVLQQQYQSAYTQAKASQAQTTAKAYETYTKDVAKLEETEEAAQASITKALEERAKRASEFQQWTWKQLGITDPEKQLTSEIYDPSQGLYPVYTDAGELTDFGRDWLQKAWLQGIEVDRKTIKLEELLDEKQQETYKDYRFEILKDIAEVELLKDEKGDYLLPDYDEPGGKTARLKTQGYIDKEIKKPTNSFKLKSSDYGLIDWGKKGRDKIQPAVTEMQKYAEDLGLSTAEVATILKNHVNNNLNDIVTDIVGTHKNESGTVARIKTVVSDFTKTQGEYEDVLNLLDNLGAKIESEIGLWSNKDSITRLYNTLLDALETAAKTKYLGA